ncbi:hypothetical protein HanRHA438_Chr08g0359111 [Helianthus annuus]|nr:hypothetical protein HanRHA438_Chr08g0359111 [Helianthus annuus]
MTMARQRWWRVGFLNMQPHFAACLIIVKSEPNPVLFRDTLLFFWCCWFFIFFSPVDNDKNISETPTDFAIYGCVRLCVNKFSCKKVFVEKKFNRKLLRKT